jgi:hypothetical protein
VKQEEVDNDNRLQLVPVEPLRPAWDDVIALSRRGTVYHAQISALNTSLPAIIRCDDDTSRGKLTRLFFPPYIPPDTRPSIQDEEFELRSQCMMHLSEMEETVNDDGVVVTNSICLFLFEVREDGQLGDKPDFKNKRDVQRDGHR